MYKAVIFDLYGTLIENPSKNEYKNELEIMSAILKIDIKEFEHYWNRETYMKRVLGYYKTIEGNLIDICKSAKVNISHEKIMNAAASRENFTKSSLEKLKDNTRAVLEGLKKRGYKIGLISDCSCDVPKYWNTCKIKSFFDSEVFSCVSGVKKPDNKIYRLSLNELDLKPDECIYVGDGGSFELTGALNAGMSPVLISYAETRMTFRHNVDIWNGRRIQNLSELMKYLPIIHL